MWWWFYSVSKGYSCYIRTIRYYTYPCASFRASYAEKKWWSACRIECMGRAFPQCAFECVPLDFLSAWSALSNERTEKAYRLRVTWCAGSMTSCRQRLFRTLHDGEFLVKTHWNLKKEISQITDQGEKKSSLNLKKIDKQLMKQSGRRVEPLGGGWDEEASWGSAKSREWEKDNL